jgi:hypothetical protein
MTGKWGTLAHRIYTGGNPKIAEREIGISYKHPEFEPPDANEILKFIGPKPKHSRRPRSSNKIKKIWNTK